MYFFIALIVATCGDWGEAKERFNRRLIFRTIFIVHVLLLLGSIGLFVVNTLMLGFVQLYCIPFYVYLLSLLVLLLRYILIFCYPWHVKWPLRGITGDGKLFL